MASYADELAKLKIVVEDDKIVIAAARWMPGMELRCCNKSCLLLGGHRAATNSIMVWCTCAEPDSSHQDGSRLMALDSWVVEHCKGEDLEDYEGGGGGDDDEDEDSDDESAARVDAMCMSEAMVVRAGRNTLPKPVPLRQLLSSTLVAQGGNKELKGASFWVYWYDQPIPVPNSPGYAGLGRTWAPGPLQQNDLGVWYRAKILKCDTTNGTVQIKYDVDSNLDTLYLLVAFAHFDKEPPTRGSRPEVLPDMDMIEYLGLPQSAAASGSVSAGGKAKGRGGGGGVGGGKKQQASSAGAAAGAAAGAKPASGKSTVTKPLTPHGQEKGQSRNLPAAAPPASLQRVSSLASGSGGGGGGGAVTKSPPVQPKLSAKRPSSPSAAVPPPAKQPVPKPPPSHSQQGQQQLDSSQPQQRKSKPLMPTDAARKSVFGQPPPAAPAARPGTAPRPGKRPRHEFEVVPLASGSAPATHGSAAPSLGLPPPPLSDAGWAHWEDRARTHGSGFLGMLCGKEEQIPVPVYNEVDLAPPPAFEYLSAAGFEGRLGADLEEAARQQPGVAAALEELAELCGASKPRWGQSCGRGYHDEVREREAAERAGGAGGRASAAAAPGPSLESSYDEEGRLLAVRPLGVHECSSASCSQPRCMGNMQLSRGVRRPLEVFRSRDRGWALRCAEPLEPGDFVAPLLGRVVAAQQVVEADAALQGGERRLPEAPGVVLLNHFFGLWEAVYVRGLNWCDQHVQLWQLPPNPLACAFRSGGSTPRGSGGGASSYYSPQDTDGDPARPAARRLPCMLALDTRRVGNVARFVRQWTRPTSPQVAAAGQDLGPALVAQPVLAGGCRSPLLYYVGLFAGRRVEAGEELTCDFSAMSPGGTGPGGAAGPVR